MTMLLLLFNRFMLFTLSAGEMGEIGGDVALPNGNGHGKYGFGYSLDSNAAAGVNMLIDERPEYKAAESGRPAFGIVAPINEGGDIDGLFNSSCSYFIDAKKFTSAASAIRKKTMLRERITSNRTRS